MSRRRKKKTRPAVVRKAKPRLLGRFKLNLKWLSLPGWPVIRKSTLAIAWLACIAALIIAWILGVPKLQAFASQRNFVDPHRITISFINPPMWVKGDLSDSLMRTASMQLNGDPLQRRDLADMRTALLETGWFDSIEQIRRVSEDQVEISAHFVTPYAIIRDDKGDHLVDVSGKLLPKNYQRGARTNFIAIAGAHFHRPQRSGMQWEGADVTAGLKLVGLIEQQPWRSQVAEIDVSGYLKDGPIKLRTDNQSTIVWGGPPGEEPALEVLAGGKLQRLNFLYEKYQRIDGGQSGGGGELDITGEKAVVAR